MHKHGGDVYTYKNVIDFSANINPLGIPESVVAAATKGAKLAAQYPDVQCRELKAALSEHENMPPEQIICGNGDADLNFYLTEDYLAELDDSIDIIFICNPNNPTGLLVEPELLEKILHKTKEDNILFVLDECFNDFLDQPDSYTLKSQIKSADNLFILKAFTKLYAMAGLRLGYGFSANTELLQSMQEVTQPWSVSTPAQYGGIAALKELEYVARTKKIIQEERKFLSNGLKELGLKPLPGQANYLFFSGPEGLAIKTREYGYMIRDCSNYYGLTKGYYRIAVRLHEENRGLVEALKKALA